MSEVPEALDALMRLNICISKLWLRESKLSRQIKSKFSKSEK